MIAAFWLAPLVTTQLEEAVESTNQIMSNLQDFGRQIIGPVISILVIVVVALLLLRLLRTMVQKTIQRVMQRQDKPARELTLKANTLASVVESLGRMLIITIATMMILTNLGVQIAPLIASAGIAGVAIGLGAQSLIRDFINGFLILLEDQYSVGDVVDINGNSGTVEALDLRRTSLRAADGTFIIIPNGDIRTVSNMTKDWSRAVIDVDISYEDDVDRVIEILTDLLAGIERDPVLGDSIIAPADILGIQALGPYQVTIRLMVKTRPSEQWRVTRELRRRIVLALRGAGISVPYPQSVTVVRPNQEMDDQNAAGVDAAVDRRAP